MLTPSVVIYNDCMIPSGASFLFLLMNTSKFFFFLLLFSMEKYTACTYYELYRIVSLYDIQVRWKWPIRVSFGCNECQSFIEDKVYPHKIEENCAGLRGSKALLIVIMVLLPWWSQSLSFSSWLSSRDKMIDFMNSRGKMNVLARLQSVGASCSNVNKQYELWCNVFRYATMRESQTYFVSDSRQRQHWLIKFYWVYLFFTYKYWRVIRNQWRRDFFENLVCLLYFLNNIG